MTRWTVKLEIAVGLYKILHLESSRSDLTEQDVADLIWELNGALSYEVIKDA